MMLFNSYYRRYGVRRVDQLVNPLKVPFKDLALPKHSLLHYIPESASDNGPTEDEFLFRGVRKPISLLFETEVTSTIGNPRERMINLASATKDFYLANRRYRRLRQLSAVDTDINTQVVFNYSLLYRRLRYMGHPLASYHQWYNIAKTAWDRIGEVIQETDRHQFVRVFLPDTAIPPATLNRFSDELDIQGLKFFDSPEKYFLLELWKWITDKRSNSILNSVQRKDLHKLNLIFIDKNAWFVLNMGKLDDWRAAPLEETSVDSLASDKGYKPLVLAKMLLRGMMDIIRTRQFSSDEIENQYGEYLTKERIEKDPASDEVQEDGVDEVEASQIRAFNLRQTNRFGTEDPEMVGSTDEETESSKRLVEKINALNKREPGKPDEDFVIDTISDEELSALERDLDEDFEVLDLIQTRKEEKEKEAEASADELLTPLPKTEPIPRTPEARLMVVADRLASEGSITGSDYNRFNRLSTKYKEIVMPNGQTMEEFAKIDPEDLVIKPVDKTTPIMGLTDKGMIGSTLDDFNSNYIRKVLEKDIVNMVLAVQQGGNAVTDFKIKEVEDAAGKYKEYTARVVPLNGKPTPLKFTIPVPDERGRFVSGGVTYRFRAQQGVSMPIKKIDWRTVALTSYYGKIFVRKPKTKVADYSRWLCNQIRLKELNGDGVKLLSQTPDIGKRFKCPTIFGYIAKEISTFTAEVVGKEYSMYFLTADEGRNSFFSPDAIKRYETAGARLFAKSDDGDFLIMTTDNQVYRINDVQGRIHMGYIETILQLNTRKAPLEYTELGVMGQDIPVAFILSYKHGLNWLLRRMQPMFRRVPMGTRLSLSDDEFAITFSDESLVFNRRETKNSLLFAGFHKYRNSIRNYTFQEFNDTAVYMNVLEDVGISYRLLNEFTRLFDMFIEPITYELLLEMKEPTEFDELLIRATELLVDGYVPVVRDRVRGYERFAGAFYNEIIRSLRAHDNRYASSRSEIDFNPNAVNISIMTDPSKMIVDEINPIEDLKQEEAVSYSGAGGRSSRSVTQDDRAYVLEEHSGLISEATVDNDKVAVNAYTAANPKFTSLRGLSEPFDPETDNMSSLVSTSMLVSPGADKDDPKRVNFINIQHGHGIACEGYTAQVVRTGYEQVIPQRTTDIFSTAAKQDGRVVSLRKEGIIVEYKDGTQVGVELGKRFGTASALTYPFNIVTHFALGDEVKKGDVIAYNEQFFEPDFLNPRGVVLKNSMPITVALMESPETFEDSSSIWKGAASKLQSSITEKHQIVVEFGQAIHNLVQPGSKVKVDDVLCAIEDSLTSDLGIYDKQSIDTLRLHSAQTPRAKVEGEIERIEVVYNGELVNMSESLRAIAEKADKQRAARRKAVGKEPITGQVLGHYQVKNQRLQPNTCVITIYITHLVPYSNGDKAVFGNQLKSITSDIMEEPMFTESGVQVDGKFGSVAVGSRIVRSPYIIGTTSRLMKELGNRAIRAYKGEPNP